MMPRDWTERDLAFITRDQESRANPSIAGTRGEPRQGDGKSKRSKEKYP